MRTLLQLFTVRVIPCAIYQIINRPSDPDLKTARLEVVKGEMLHTLRFSGPWTERNLDPLRDALRRAAEELADLVLDLAEVTYADAAFLGLVMIAYGYQSRTGRGFSIRAMSKRFCTILHLHACEFLIAARRGPERNEDLPKRDTSARS
jgi:anti-anti-sigma regulatory factor